ncbi:hypothetical protein [Prevotella nigrescens]
MQASSCDTASFLAVTPMVHRMTEGNIASITMHGLIVFQSSEYRYSRCQGEAVFICLETLFVVTPKQYLS